MIYKFHFQGNHSEKVVDLDLQHITSSIILLYIQIQLKYMMLICFAFNLKWIYLCTSVVTLNRSSQHYSGVSVSPVCLNRQSLEGTQLVCSKYYFFITTYSSAPSYQHSKPHTTAAGKNVHTTHPIKNKSIKTLSIIFKAKDVLKVLFFINMVMCLAWDPCLLIICACAREKFREVLSRYLSLT